MFRMCNMCGTEKKKVERGGSINYNSDDKQHQEISNGESKKSQKKQTGRKQRWLPTTTTSSLIWPGMTPMVFQMGVTLLLTIE